MFVRFVIPQLDEDSGRRQGVFHTAYTLRDGGSLSLDAQVELHLLLNWFGRRLAVPDTFSRSRRKSAHRTAICWFKDSATDCVSRMHQLCGILRDQAIFPEMLKSTRPGYIVFEDQHQVAAVPFSETPA